MARDRGGDGASAESVISIIGPGMKVIGDCETDGTIRVEGTVEGSVRAGKAVVVGRDGVVSGEITTQDAVVSGTVIGTLVAESRLELQATCRIEGEIKARRMQLEEGAIINGTVQMGEVLARAEEASTETAAKSVEQSDETGAGLADPSSKKQTFPQSGAAPGSQRARGRVAPQVPPAQRVSRD